MINVEEKVQELINSTDKIAKEIFENPNKMRDFLKTLGKMYNTSYNNILLLKSQKENVSFVATKEEYQKYKYKIKDDEKPLEIIKRIKMNNDVKFKVVEVYDISQTNAIKKKKEYKKEYVDVILKGMCERRNLYYDPNNQMENIESIVSDISNNTRSSNASYFDVDRYASQSQAEVIATIFAVAKKLGINTRNYNLTEVCKWGVEKENRSLKESLKYMQKFVNYFVKDFEAQEKIYRIEHQKEDEEEMEQGIHSRKGIMEEKFSIKMNKDEMLRYYENKIVEDGIKSCTEFNTIVNLRDYNTNEIKLEKYKNQILQLLYRDERVADVLIDDEFNVDMVFYTDYCPFYYDDEKNVIYNEIMDSPTYQGIELAEFVGYMGKRIIEDSYISTRNLINNYVQTKNLKDTDKEILANFLKKSIIETGFTEKYIDNINVFVTYKNFQELEKGLMEIVKQKNNESLKKIEEEEFE